MVYHLPFEYRDAAHPGTAHWFTLRFFRPEPLLTIPETVEIETGGDPVGSVIWLHGLGADGHDFGPIVPELGFDGRLALRFVFPHAPVRPVTINGGVSMRAWYDILTLDRGGPQDETGIRESGALLEALIEREHSRGMPSGQIVLAGFSQGGAIAAHTALRYPEPLAGLMALSTYLPLRDRLQAEVVEASNAQPVSLPIFMAHGRFDPVIPVALGADTRDQLSDAGYDVEWRDYPMAHAVSAEEIHDISRWLRARFDTS
jgi:phospholipase/carboxylesterase